MTPAKLSWIHFFKASLVGFVLLPVLAMPAGIAYEWSNYAADPAVYANMGKPDAWNTALTWALSGAVWGSIFLGIPAVLVGLLRAPLMRFLFAYCQHNGHGAVLAITGTFVVFELSVWFISILIPTKVMLQYPTWLFCFVVSLPWLLSSLWATWSLRHELSVPVDENYLSSDD